LNDSIIQYWNKVNRADYACPNPILYRLLNSIGMVIKDKYFLDLGCGVGQELFEILKRGGKPYGIDIDDRVIKKINRIKTLNALNYPIVYNGSIIENIENIFQSLSFDIVLSQDTIYYLDDKSFNKCLDNVNNILKRNGVFIIKVITGDYAVKNNQLVFDSKSITKDSGNPIIYRNKDYYIKFLMNNNFNIIAEKKVSESFFIHCESIRHELYLVAKKMAD